MTPEEIQALIDIKLEELATLEDELKEALAKVFVDIWFANILALKVEYDDDDLTALQTESKIQTLLH